MRSLFAVTLALVAPSALVGQVPVNLAAIELERSRSCVPVLGRLDVLDKALEPLAIRSQRLLGIAQAVALEDDAVVANLDDADPVEAAVRAWFATDAAVAARILEQSTPELQEERAVGREAIKTTITEALEGVQAQADSIVVATGDLQQAAGRCTGAVLIRSAVLESCGSTSSPVCDAARDSTAGGPEFRFVNSAESVWDVQELRAWTAPGPLSVTPNGQVGGARTVGATRLGNVVVNVAFAPWLQERSNMTAVDSARVQALTDSLGFGGAHPDLLFLPSLVVRASLPESLGGESDYLLHFGPPDSAEVVWQAPAGTGAPVEGIVPLSPVHLVRLQAGEPMTLTAIREAEDGELDALWTMELTSLNQVPAVSGLLGYMANQLPGDLARLLPPDNS